MYYDHYWSRNILFWFSDLKNFVPHCKKPFLRILLSNRCILDICQSDNLVLGLEKMQKGEARANVAASFITEHQHSSQVCFQLLLFRDFYQPLGQSVKNKPNNASKLLDNH